MKINSKQWLKVRVSIKNKSLTATKQVFKSMTEGCESITSTNSNFAIMNKAGILKLVADGYTVSGLELDVPVTETPKMSWEPEYTVGNPVVEEQIRAYTESKLKRQGVMFSKGVTERNQYGTTAREILGETVFKKQEPINMTKAYERFNKSVIGQERKERE